MAVGVCRIRAARGVQCRRGHRSDRQDLIEVDAAETIGAGRYERSDTRTSERNGYRDLESRKESRICAGLDEQVGEFRNRPLHHTHSVYVFLDATYLHVRHPGPGG